MKTVNWTTEVTAKAVEAYTNGTDIEVIAKDLGKTVPSVRSKLVSEGVYVAKTPAAKTATTTRKIEYVKALEALTGLDNLESLEKANREALEALTSFLMNH